MVRILAAALLWCSLAGPAWSQALSVALAGRPMPSRLTFDSLRWDQEVIDAALAACPLGPARATIYYVSPTGSDAALGTSPGAAFQTMSRAQTALTASSGNVAVLFKRGGEWKEAVGLTVAKNNATIGAYDVGPRPILSAFINSYAGGGSLWTLVTGGRYTTAAATEVGGIREKNNIYKCYRKAASTVEVETIPNTYFWAAGVLHLHATNAAGATVDPDSITNGFEYTLASATDDSGVDVSSGFTGIRIDSVECHGWGYDGGIVNQEYGILVKSTGSDLCVVSNCGGYYSARHAMGHNPGAGSSGGLVVWINNDVGYCTENNAGIFVSYAGLGLWEDFYVGCTAAYGSTLTTGAVPWANGTAIYAHTGGDANRFGLLVVRDLVVKAPANGMGCSSAVQYQNSPTATGPADCRVVLINTTMERALGTGFGNIGHVFALKNSIEIGGTYRLLPRPCPFFVNMAAGATGDNILATGWMIGTSLEVDLANITESWFGFWSNTGNHTYGPKLWHCQLNVLGNGSTNFALSYSRAFDSVDYTYDSLGEFVNSTFAARRYNPATAANVASGVGAETIRVGLGLNNATKQRNNAVFSMSVNGVYTSFSNAVNTVTLGKFPQLGQAVWEGMYFAGAGEGGRIEFDSLLRSRDPVAPAIGPVEVISERLAHPTSAELVAMLEAGTLADLQAYLPATGPLASAGDVSDVEGKVDSIEAKTDLLPAAVAGSAGGLPTVTAGNFIAGIAGTINTLDGVADASADDMTALTNHIDGRTLTSSGYATATAVDAIDNLVDEEIGAIKTKTDYLPSAAAGTQNGVALTSTVGAGADYVLDEMPQALDAQFVRVEDAVAAAASASAGRFDDLDAAVGEIEGGGGGMTAEELLEALGLAEGNLDTQLDGIADGVAAIDSELDEFEPSAAQPRINFLPEPAFTRVVPNAPSGSIIPQPVKIPPGAVGDAAVYLDMSVLYGKSNFVRTVGTPTISGGSVTVAASGPRDYYAVVVLNGTATAGESRTVTVPVTMSSGATRSVKFTLQVFAE